MTIRELLQKRAELIAQARGILDTADAEKRGMTQEEENRYNAIMAKVEELRVDIDRRERQERLELEIGQPSNRQVLNDSGQSLTVEFVSRSLRSINENTPEVLDEPAWRQLFSRMTPENIRAFQVWLRGRELGRDEQRALQAADDETGGYLVTPMQFVDRLIQAVDNAVFIRQLATTFAVPNAASLGVVSLDSDPADPAWTNELAIGSEDSSMDFGKREFKPQPLAKYIKISRKLLRMVPSVEGLVQQRLGYKFAVTMENAYMNGDGAAKPLGLFTASDQGISTGRDVSTDNATDAPTADGLKNAKWTLKGQYWPRASWIFHRDCMKIIDKLKDGNGQYLWQPGLQAGQPDKLLGFPFRLSEYCPATFTTGLYVGILGDFSYYWIADALNLEMQRLVELYAATNQVGYIGRMESDGMPVLEEAFVRVKLG